MADKKDLPVSSGGHFLPYRGQTNINAVAVANANGSQVLSSNFNPLAAAATIGFNPMAAGYPGAASAFYSPFSMLPFAASAAANPTSAAAFLNAHHPSNMFSSSFPAASAMWPGLLPPEYLLNIAALQSLQQQPNLAASMIDGTSETFSDVLKKMPKATANSAVAGPPSSRISACGSSRGLDSLLPPSSNCAPAFKTSAAAKVDATSSISKVSPPASSSFSATSLAIGDQKPSTSSAESVGKNDLSSLKRHSSSLATLAEIASSLQNNHRVESKAPNSKQTGDQKSTLATSQLDGKVSSQANQCQQRKTVIETIAKNLESSAKSVLDFSRKRPASNKDPSENGDILHSKEPKLENIQTRDSPTVSSNQKSVDRRSQQTKFGSAVDGREKDGRLGRHLQEAASVSGEKSAAATLFGASLSSDLKMDPNLLNASAMAWAALSNQWLLANVQNELLNRAAAATAAQKHVQQSTSNGGAARQHSVSKSPAEAASASANSASGTSKKARVKNDEDAADRRNGRGRPATISVSSSQQQSSLDQLGDKDAVDVTIDAVIRQQQQEFETDEHSKSASSRSRRGKGSRGGITVREQLAARREHHWNATASATSTSAASCKKPNQLSNGSSADVSSTSKPSSEKMKTTSVGLSDLQTAALDLSVKANLLRSAGAHNSGGDAYALANGSDFGSDRNQGVSSESRRKLAESSSVRIPLTKGWRRQTYVRSISSNCVRGDVIYYAPCGKRLGSYAEVIRYLNKHDIRDITRENFSFSCKVLVGEFLQVKSYSGKSGMVKLNEKEIRDLLAKMQPAADRLDVDVDAVGSDRSRGVRQKAFRHGLNSLSRRSASRRSTGARFGTMGASDRRRKNLAILKPLSAGGTRHAWETKRLDREREAQLVELERKRKMGAMRNQKVMEALQRAKAKEIRQQNMDSFKKQEGQYMQQMIVLASIEREKVRQQMMFARALQARKRQEEKESLYAEKLIRREERLAARTASLIRMRQMRQPVEDLEIEDSKELPQLTRMGNMELSGQAFADLLMVMEFINNFGHVLRIDKAEIPSINQVHAGLLNDRRHVQSLRSLVKTLLLLVLEYPGLPAGNGGKTLLGQSAKDVGVTDMNMTELLRMFLLSRDDEGKKLGNELNDLPFEALTPDRKASVLAYMCNELLYCRNVVREIEGNIDVIAKFKSDRWSLEGKIRHMKVVKASKRKDSRDGANVVEANANNTASPSADSIGLEASSDATIKITADDDEEDGESSDSDAKMDTNQEATSKKMPKMLFGITAGEIESISKEEKLMPVEEVDKELERLYKEMHDLRARVNEVFVRIRASPFGQDRYNRYYWILPHHAGVFVEGVESGGINNPAIRQTHVSVRMPSPTVAAVRSSSPTRQIDEVRSCVSDMIDAVARSDPCQLDKTYVEVKRERLGVSSQEMETAMESSKMSGRSRIQGSKKMRQIPVDLQRGWWLVDNGEQLDSLPPHLYHKGIRERHLCRTLTKHGDHIKRDAFSADKKHVQFNAVTTAVDIEPENLTLRTARRLLNMTRQLEEKVFQANVHVRGWKPTDTSSEASSSNSSTESGSSDSSCDSMLDARDKFSSFNTGDLLTVVKERLLQLEQSIERRYFTSAFNRDAYKMCASSNSSSATVATPVCSNDLSAQSLPNSSVDGADTMEDEDSEDDDIPLALQRWRSGVGKASNIAQLSMCLEELDAQVSWEKSVMKASCQICRGGDNESQLLLCDGCDMGYHTYCFKPKLETVPEGDWYCPECIAKASRRPCCLLCCRQGGRPMIACSHCSKNFHLDCLAGPVKKTRSGGWTCNGCCNAKSQPKKARSNSVDGQHATSVASVLSVVESAPAKKKPSKKTATSARSGSRASASSTSTSTTDSAAGPLKFHEICGIMLAELDAHKDAEAFRLPVDMKGCPLYKKIIKQPMDLSTIQSKLTGKKYENESEFVNDVKLIFDNCRTFNEDDSSIGKAGHALRRYFNRRWKELKGSTNKK